LEHEADAGAQRHGNNTLVFVSCPLFIKAGFGRVSPVRGSLFYLRRTFMNKKFFLCGMAALLSVSLFFLGCPGDSDDDDEVKSPAQNLGDSLGSGVTVAGDVVTLTADKEIAVAVVIPSGVTLVVPANRTLTVMSGGSLTVTGTLRGAVGGTDTAASQIVVQSGGTVTGGSFYLAGESLATVVAGVYTWDAAAGGATAGWKQTALDVKAAYSLKESEDDATAAASGLNIVSVLKDTTTNLVTITLDGEFDAEYLYTSTNDDDNSENVKGDNWDYATWDASNVEVPRTGTYGAVYVNGLFPAALSNVAIQIRPYPALAFYASGGISATELEGPVITGANVYVAATGDDHQKWKFYASKTAGETFGVLLYDEAVDKTVTLDIDQYPAANGEEASKNVSEKISDILTVTIDYSAVVFPDTTPPEPAPADGD
jgi:hypothetical protein